MGDLSVLDFIAALEPGDIGHDDAQMLLAVVDSYFRRRAQRLLLSMLVQDLDAVLLPPAPTPPRGIPDAVVARMVVPLDDPRPIDRAADCAVCWESYGSQDVARLPCAHEFHHTCLRNWFSDHTTCPLCRSSADAPTADMATLSSAPSSFASQNAQTQTVPAIEAAPGAVLEAAPERRESLAQTAAALQPARQSAGAMRPGPELPTLPGSGPHNESGDRRMAPADSGHGPGISRVARSMARSGSRSRSRAAAAAALPSTRPLAPGAVRSSTLPVALATTGTSLAAGAPVSSVQPSRTLRSVSHRGGQAGNGSTVGSATVGNSTLTPSAAVAHAVAPRPTSTAIRHEALPALSSRVSRHGAAAPASTTRPGAVAEQERSRPPQTVGAVSLSSPAASSGLAGRAGLLRYSTGQAQAALHAAASASGSTFRPSPREAAAVGGARSAGPSGDALSASARVAGGARARSRAPGPARLPAL
jgi:hypothetical protein